jgi:site-specific recombinase XerC
MDFKRAIETFDVYMSGSNFSDSTRSLYQWALDFLCNYLQNPQLTAIIPDDLNRFWGWIHHDYEPTRRSGKPGPLAGRSLENIWTAERSFFGWCVETGKLKKRPDLQIKRPEYAPREVLPFTTEEVTRMLAATERAKIAETDRRTPFTMPRATANLKRRQRKKRSPASVSTYFCF